MKDKFLGLNFAGVQVNNMQVFLLGFVAVF